MRQYLFPRQLGLPLVGLLFALGTFADRIQPARSNEVTYAKVTNHSTKVNTATSQIFDSQTLVKNSAVAPSKAKLPQKDGTYLYGQSPKPSQLGQGYIVFEKQQGKVIGALYMPHSEFSCFNGTLDSRGELAMTVTGYPGDKSQTQIATNSNIPTLMDDEPSVYAHEVGLQEYYPLNVSANDRRILQMCKNQL
ncbi:hypothetical protein NUACC21_28150 [Scytonema sp. NUACC21]